MLKTFRTTIWAGRVVFFLLFLGFFVASHTVTSLATVTSTAISAIAGTTSTVMGRSKVRATDLSSENAKLRTDLNQEKRRASGLATENKRLRKATTVNFQGRLTTVKQATREVIDRAMTRTTRSTVANVSSIPGESVPFFGIAIVLAATTYELKAACENMIDFHNLQVALDVDTVRPEDRRSVCALQIPTKKEVWSKIKESPKDAWDGSVATLGSVAEGVKNLETPDFGGPWRRFTLWLGEHL